MGQLDEKKFWGGVENSTFKTAKNTILFNERILVLRLKKEVQFASAKGTIRNFKKIKKLIMTKTMRLGGPLTLAQKRRKSPNILPQVCQRRPATNMGQKSTQSDDGTMPPMSSNKQWIFMKPNNKGTKNSTCGTAPAKAAIAKRRCHAKKTDVHSQPRSRRSLTRRWKSSSRIITAPLALRVANPL